MSMRSFEFFFDTADRTRTGAPPATNSGHGNIIFLRGCCVGFDFMVKGEKMEVDLIFKIAAIGIIVAVLNQLLTRAGRDDQAMLTTIAGLIVVLSMIATQISDLFNEIKTLFGL